MDNVSGHLWQARDVVRKRVYDMFARVDVDLGRRIEDKAEERARREGAVAMPKL